jgi:hypothetical protein
MWAMLKTLLAHGLLAKSLVRSVGWLAWLLPIGFLLKVIGWPIILVLGVLAAPVLILLFIIGLPIFAVILVGSLLMSLVGVLLTVGITLLKFAIPVLLIYWVVRWLWWKPAPISAAPAPQ